MKPRKNNQPDRASRKFQDREEPRKVFWEEFETISNEMTIKDSDIHVISYYGIGGVGKTRLIKKLAEEMDTKSANYAIYDLENGQDRINVLQAISKLLTEKYKFVFPLFEYGKYLYMSKLGEDANAPKTTVLLEKNPVVSSIKKALDLVPVVNEVVKVAELVDDIQSKVRTYAQNNQKIFKSFEYLNAKELYNKLPQLFAEDLENSIEKSGKPLVILLDTYEKLVNELIQSGVAYTNDKWLRDDVIAIVPNVLWVICGREYLNWEQYDVEWKEAINSHLLGNLSVKDTEEFLESEGITDADLSKDLYRLTNGTPLYLDICVDTYLQFKEQNPGVIPAIGIFGENTSELVERFIRYMDTNSQELVFSLICLENWTDELIESIGYKIYQNFNFVLYERIKNLSFIICENGKYYVHKTVSEILLQKCPTQIKNKVAEALVDKFKPIVQSKKHFSTSYGEALAYIVRAGILIHISDENELSEFLDDNIYRYLLPFSYNGFFEEADYILDTLAQHLTKAKPSLLLADVIFCKSRIREFYGYNEDAINMTKTEINLRQNILGVSHPDIIQTKSRLAFLLKNSGQLQDALKVNQQVFEKSRLVFGEEHPDTISVMNKLADILEDLGDFQEALEIRRQVFEKHKKKFGEGHVETLWAMDRLAHSLNLLGKKQDALEIKIQFVEKCKQNLSEDKSDFMDVMYNLARVLGDLDKHQEALEVKQEIFKKCKQNLGENHSDTIDAMRSIARTLGCLGEYKEKLKVEQHIIEILRQTLGENNPDTIFAMNDLIITLKVLEKQQEALEIQQQICENLKKAIGEDHPDTLYEMSILANMFESLEKYPESLKIRKKVFKKYKNALGEHHTDTQSAMLDLVLTRIHLCEEQEVFELYNNAIEFYTIKLGDNHPDTIYAMRRFASEFECLGKYHEALEIRQKIFEKLSCILGEDHPDTIRAMEILAHNYENAEKYNMALKLYQRIYEKQKQLFGENHPDTIRAQNNLNYCIRYAQKNQ